jgi:hypothetical protein
MNEIPALVTVTPMKTRIKLAKKPAITPNSTEVRIRERGGSTAWPYTLLSTLAAREYWAAIKTITIQNTG